MPDGKIGRRLCPAGSIRPGQTGKLPIVRREHNGRAGAVEHRHVLRDGKERVGIKHERRAGLRNDRLHQRRECITASETGAEHAHIAFLQPLEQYRQRIARQLPLRRRQRERHRLVVFHGGDGIDRLRHADGHQSGAAAQSRAGAQRRRAGIADAAADDEHAAVVIFIGIGRAPRQIRRAGCNAMHDLPPGRKRGDFSLIIITFSARRVKFSSPFTLICAAKCGINSFVIEFIAWIGKIVPRFRTREGRHRLRASCEKRALFARELRPIPGGSARYRAQSAARTRRIRVVPRKFPFVPVCGTGGSFFVRDPARNTTNHENLATEELFA